VQGLAIQLFTSPISFTLGAIPELHVPCRALFLLESLCHSSVAHAPELVTRLVVDTLRRAPLTATIGFWSFTLSSMATLRLAYPHLECTRTLQCVATHTSHGFTHPSSLEFEVIRTLLLAPEFVATRTLSLWLHAHPFCIERVVRLVDLALDLQGLATYWST